jgi:hypothetical protein
MAGKEIYRKYRQGYTLFIVIINFIRGRNRTEEKFQYEDMEFTMKKDPNINGIITINYKEI